MLLMRRASSPVVRAFALGAMLSASLVDQPAALDAGARFFLTKPYRGETLVTAVQSALGRTPPEPR